VPNQVEKTEKHIFDKKWPQQTIEMGIDMGHGFREEIR
jgi:hypothetical protein